MMPAIGQSMFSATGLTHLQVLKLGADNRKMLLLFTPQIHVRGCQG